MVGNPYLIALRQSCPSLGRNLSGPLPSESLRAYSLQEGVGVSEERIGEDCIAIDAKALLQDLFLLRRIYASLQILESGVRAQGI